MSHFIHRYNHQVFFNIFLRKLYDLRGHSGYLDVPKKEKIRLNGNTNYVCYSLLVKQLLLPCHFIDLMCICSFVLCI